MIGILMDLNVARIDSETAHGVIETLEDLATPKMRRVLEAEAKDCSELPAQASMLVSLIRDKTPELKAAIDRSEYYDDSDIAVMGEAEVEELTIKHVSEAQKRLGTAISSQALKANLTNLARPEARDQVKARPDLQFG